MIRRIGWARCIVRLGYVPRGSSRRCCASSRPPRSGRALVERGRAAGARSVEVHQPPGERDLPRHRAGARGRLRAASISRWTTRPARTCSSPTQSLLMDSHPQDRRAGALPEAHPPRAAVRGPASAPPTAGWRRTRSRCWPMWTASDAAGAGARRRSSSEFDVTKVVFRLLEGGYASSPRSRWRCAAAAQEAPPRARADGHRRRGRARPAAADGEVARVFNLIFREIRERGRPSRAWTAELHRRGQRGARGRRRCRTRRCWRGWPSRRTARCPRRAVGAFEHLRAAGSGAEPIASLRQALSDVMFFLLFQAGELLESARGRGSRPAGEGPARHARGAVT